MIQQFQNDLYNLLNNNQEIQKNLYNVYLNYQKNSRTPFIVIELLKANNIASCYLITYDLNFSISIFTSNSYTDKHATISKQIQSILTPKQFIQKHYSVVSLGIQSISWHADKQLIINKLSLNYKSILQQYRK